MHCLQTCRAWQAVQNKTQLFTSSSMTSMQLAASTVKHLNTPRISWQIGVCILCKDLLQADRAAGQVLVILTCIAIHSVATVSQILTVAVCLPIGNQNKAGCQVLPEAAACRSRDCYHDTMCQCTCHAMALQFCDIPLLTWARDLDALQRAV